MDKNSNFTIPKITKNKRRMKETVKQGKAYFITHIFEYNFKIAL